MQQLHNSFRRGMWHVKHPAMQRIGGIALCLALGFMAPETASAQHHGGGGGSHSGGGHSGGGSHGGGSYHGGGGYHGGGYHGGGYYGGGYHGGGYHGGYWHGGRYYPYSGGWYGGYYPGYTYGSGSGYGYGSGYGTTVVVPPNPPVNPPVVAGDPTQLVYPPTASGPLSYTLNGYPYTIRPGESQTLNPGSWVLEFDRGDGFGTARYTLAGGVFTFGPSDHGWEVYRRN